MQRVSSNLTLFYKFFVPVFWTVFFGAVTLAVLLTDYAYVGNIPRGTFQLLVVAFFLSGVLLFAFTLLRLKRVEMSPDFVYVTNYFKNFRYPYQNIEKLEINRFLLFYIATLHLRQAGSFGRKITFVANYYRLRDFLDNHPAVQEMLQVEDHRS